jgi:hypothetical protein
VSVVVADGRPTTTIAAINRRLDGLARTTVVAAGRRLPAFRVCGTTGYVVAVITATGLALAHGLSAWLMLALCGVGALTFIVLSAYVRDADGRERLVYYHHQAAVLATTTATLVIAGAPVLPYVDLVAIGLGLFLAFGRVGCLMVGCCHGRPARVGIRYGPAHVQEGFPAHREGVRLLPIQALESAWTLVAVGIAIAATLRAPGAGLAAYVVTYATGRFALEYLRGDGARPYLLAVSEAQWTSLALAAAVVAAEATGHLPEDVTHTPALALMAAATAGTLVLAWLRRGLDRVLLTPRHLDELAMTATHLAGVAAVDSRLTPAAGPVPSAVHVAATSQGLTISASTLARSDGAVHHFGLSRAAGLTPQTAAELGNVLCVLTGDEPRAALPSRGGDVYHLTIVHRR